MIYLGSDHAGFKLKEHIKKFFIKKKISFADLGPLEYDKNDDYPDYVTKVCKKVKKEKAFGILVCCSGQGVSIAANKFKGIRASLCCDIKLAKSAKEHVNANVLCLSSYMSNNKKSEKIIQAWLSSEFSNKLRHIRRINKIKKIEKSN